MIRLRRLLPALALALATVATSQAKAAKQINCTDGIHYEIDIRKLAIRYQANGLEATLSGLSLLGARVEVAPKTLQQAAVATQKLNEFIKALASGYNSCAISKQAYEQGIKGSLQGMKSDGKALEALRQELLAERKIDANQLEKLLAGYNDKLQRLARISGRAIDYERISSIVDEQLSKHTGAVLAGQTTNTDLILARLDQLAQLQKKAPLPTPQQVKTDISAIKQQLLTKADEAEAAYNEGYALLKRYRFAEAIPHLQRALGASKLLAFYVALGEAYGQLGDFGNAQNVLQEGLNFAGDPDQLTEFSELINVLKLTGMLAHVYVLTGDLDNAIKYRQKEAELEQRAFPGPLPNTGFLWKPDVAELMQLNGDIEGGRDFYKSYLKHVAELGGVSTVALERTDVELSADTPYLFGTEGKAWMIANSLYASGNLSRAQHFAELALQISEKGREVNQDLAIAQNAFLLASILKDKGDLVVALSYAQRALKLFEQHYSQDSSSSYNVQKSEALIKTLKSANGQS